VTWAAGSITVGLSKGLSVLREIDDHLEKPGLWLSYWVSGDRVTGHFRASHSNQKETRTYHFECEWPDGTTPQIKSLTVAGKVDEPWQTETKGIGMNKRADLHVKARQLAVKWRDVKIAEQRAISERIRQPDVAKFVVKDEHWLMNRGKVVEYLWADGCLVKPCFYKPPPGVAEWWDVIEVGPVDRETAEYLAKLHLEMREADLAIEAARGGLGLKQIKAIVAAEEEQTDAGKRMLLETSGRSG